MALGVKFSSNIVVTKLKIPKELEIVNNTGTVQYTVNFQLSGTEGHTVVTCATTVSTDNAAFAFTGAILKRLARRELQADMQALKLAVENHLE